MLTVDYDRLGVRPGDTLLDLGCGFGRHAFEAARRGAAVVALDAGPDEVAGVRDTFGAMVDAGELDAATARAGAVQGDALRLPFPDGTFDRVIASEVLEHIPDDVSAMARAGAGAAAGRHHGRHRAALRSRVRQLGPLRRVPRRARGPRAHLPAVDAAGPPVLDRPGAGGQPPRPRSPLALLVAPLPGRPDQRRQPGGGHLPPAAGVGHRQRSPHHPAGRPAAQPAHRQEPGGLPAQARTAGGRGRPARRPESGVATGDRRSAVAA